MWASLLPRTRSHYYEKVGFRGVEEKKSLDILLAEKPIEREKLQSFCLRLKNISDLCF
jgi:hypothetical protein